MTLFERAKQDIDASVRQLENRQAAGMGVSLSQATTHLLRIANAVQVLMKCEKATQKRLRNLEAKNANKL